MQPVGLIPPYDAVFLIPAPVGDPRKLVGHGLLFHLFAVLVQLHMGIDPRPDNQGVEGLRYIVHGSQDKPALLAGHVGKAGDQDHRHVLGGIIVLELLQQRKAVHPRHHHIQQDQREIPLPCKAQPLLPLLCNGDVILVLEDGLQLGRLQGAVVNNQNFFHTSSRKCK